MKLNDEKMMLRLRPYKSCDAVAISSWIKNEITMFKWSADRFGSFPVTADAINEKYLIHNGDCTEPDNFYPMTAFDDSGVVGHLILRFTDEEKQTIRFGFVIVDDTRRGKGYGKEMLNLAIKYAFEILKAKKITLGVFENNPPAYYCYKSVGFTEIVGKQDGYHNIKNEKWKCIELEMKEADYETAFHAAYSSASSTICSRTEIRS